MPALDMGCFVSFDNPDKLIHEFGSIDLGLQMNVGMVFGYNSLFLKKKTAYSSYIYIKYRNSNTKISDLPYAFATTSR